MIHQVLRCFLISEKIIKKELFATNNTFNIGAFSVLLTGITVHSYMFFQCFEIFSTKNTSVAIE